MTAEETITTAAAQQGLILDALFVPWSRSRNAKEREPSLNWRVTLKRNGRDVLTADYSAGCGHCPSYKQGRAFTQDEWQAVKWECEHGQGFRAGRFTYGPPILPALPDVLASLVSDASALDYATFEDWASDVGADHDSRAAEATYRACLDTGLKLRAALGEDGLSTLREACQDY